MSWATPPVFVSGNVLTAAQMNVLTNDLLVTIPAVATSGLVNDSPFAGGTGYGPGVYAASAANTVAEMKVGQNLVTAVETTTSSAFADLATVGPQVSVTCNNLAIVFANVALMADTTNTAATGWAVDGATTIAASNNGPSLNGAANTQLTGVTWRAVTVNAGLNTFTLRYVVSAGTTGTFWRRHMTVWPF